MTAQLKIMDPGIYFGLPDDDYHEAFALSNSGVKRMRVSSYDFWAGTAMNPLRTDTDTEAMAAGRAYDKRIIEGARAFEAAYAPALDRADYPDAIDTVSEIKAALATFGITKGLSGLNKPDLIHLLVDTANANGREVEVWDAMKAQHEQMYEGREFLHPALVRQIELAARMIALDEQLAPTFTDGFPKVCVFWNDPETHIPMKCQWDYMKLQVIPDYKTFENSRGMSLHRAAQMSIATYKYHVQGRFYLNAATVAHDLIKAGRIFGDHDPTFVRMFAEQDPSDRQFMLLFQQKGPAPVPLGIVLPPFTMSLGEEEIRMAARKFALKREQYGTDVWLDPQGVFFPDAEEFPSWIAE